MHTNKLINEKSPYLLQHAHNPVDWYPWGEEAFQKARDEDKPLLISIGYSTCHWCHVMERESFEDTRIADILNKYFVAVKVDREERPDIDMIYMSAAQILNGQGGWPLNVFVTPEGKPFFAGTYFPPQDKWGRPGFDSLLERIAYLWREKREDINRSGEAITEAIKDLTIVPKEVQDRDPGAIIDAAFNKLEEDFDSTYGGFSQAPKFPRAHTISFLLRYYKRSGNEQALQMAQFTLDAIAAGGIYDQIGGGFHRYSVDRLWRIPHFEKMLYDQAILTRAYLELYQITGDETYAGIVRETFDYLLKDMRDQTGGFYSALDADSAVSAEAPDEKSEGAYYLWGYDEIDEILGSDADIFRHIYGVQENGNAPEDPHGDFADKNVLYIKHNLKDAAGHFQKSEDEIKNILARAKNALFAKRRERVPPHLDDKILTDWNGLLIASLAYGGMVLKEEKYVQAAREAADFILERMMIDDGYLLHRYRDESADIAAYVDDYAFLAHGLIDLYQATHDVKYLQNAKDIAQKMIELFWDDSEGGFYFTGARNEKLLVRSKEYYDGALPSGNSVAALTLLRLSRLLMDEEFEKTAMKLIELFTRTLAHYPSGYTQMLHALDFAVGPSTEVVIVAAGDDGHEELLNVVREEYLPNRVLHLKDANGQSADLNRLVPYIKDFNAHKGRASAYVCRNYTCQAPVTEPKVLRESLQK